MKKIFLSLIVALLCVTPALANESYFSLTGSTFSPEKTTTLGTDISYNSDWGFGAALGAALGDPAAGGMRVETELTYRQAPAKGLSEELWVLDWTLNGWWDFRNRTGITPYVGGGIGVARGRAASPGMFDNSGKGFTYLYGAGIDFPIYKKVSLDVGYRHYAVKEFDPNGFTSFSPSWSAFTGGLRVKY